MAGGSTGIREFERVYERTMGSVEDNLRSLDGGHDVIKARRRMSLTLCDDNALPLPVPRCY